jgi:DnaK suppressor protein
MSREMRLKPRAGSPVSSQARGGRRGTSDGPRAHRHAARGFAQFNGEFRTRLEAERRRLQAELRAINQRAVSAEDSPRAGAVEGGDDDAMADAASQMLDRDRDLAVESSLRILLAEVEQALTRLRRGSYGTCVRCRRPIQLQRLRVIPYATLCIACKEDEEKTRTQAARVPFREWRALRVPRDWDEDEASGKR